MQDNDSAWKSVPGYEGIYEASDRGQVRSLDRIVVMRNGRRRPTPGVTLRPEKRGGRIGREYLSVLLSKNGRVAQASVHVVVLSAFNPQPSPELIVCHDNGNPTDNRLSNLYWGTRQDNGEDMKRHGTDWHANKTHCPYDHAYDGPNLYRTYNRVKGGKNPSRGCKACIRARGKISYERRAGRPAPNLQVLSDKYYAEIMAGYTPPAIPSPRIPIDSATSNAEGKFR